MRDHCSGHINALLICELSIGQLISFLMVEPVYQGFSSRIGTGARIILDLFQDLTGNILSVASIVRCK